MPAGPRRPGRRIRNGNRDRGGIAGIRAHGQRIVIETKDCARTELAAWIREAHTEAGNDDALAGVVVSKRRGVGDPLSQWVHMELRDLIALLTGQPQDGRYE
ncbi:MAG: hypothetical protein JOZ23_17120 [Mycobacterium sp.]|nr:hypothetical protein [Mycobacterium sp.]